ncbi:MAG: carboxypeptidase-like regulatory domain-containing protein, partial [Terrimonas sp.]|nr:carboxypeptidase-like regulatory domain-containing protein [Terrimonas sp.]
MKKRGLPFSTWKRCGMILILLLAFHYYSFSQDILKISGIVADSANGSPLAGVTVSVAGTTKATKTNNAGVYNIDVVKGASLVFTFTGYNPKTIVANNDNDINISLGAISQNLSEVVVVSYGTQKKREITGAIANINGKELKDIPVTNVGQKLQGRLAGV